MGPKEGKLPWIDETVLCFIAEIYIQGLSALCLEMQIKMEKLSKFSEYMKRNFKAIGGYVLKRMMLKVLNHWTSICGKPFANFEWKQINFQQHVIQLRKNV